MRTEPLNRNWSSPSFPAATETTTIRTDFPREFLLSPPPDPQDRRPTYFFCPSSPLLFWVSRTSFRAIPWGGEFKCTPKGNAVHFSAVYLQSAPLCAQIVGCRLFVGRASLWALKRMYRNARRPLTWIVQSPLCVRAG